MVLTFFVVCVCVFWVCLHREKAIKKKKRQVCVYVQACRFYVSQTMCTKVSAYMQVCEVAEESQLGDKREESTNDGRKKSERETRERKKALTMHLSFRFPSLNSPCFGSHTAGMHRLQRCVCLCVRECASNMM